MLEHLFGSRTRIKLLGMFLRHPKQPFYVRELSRLLETQMNAVRRELANLVHLGMIEETVVVETDAEKKTSKGLKKKFYHVNTSFPLLAEISSLMVKSRVLLEKRLDQEILKMGDIRYLAFLGCFLGTHAPVDIFIVGCADESALRAFVTDAEKDLGFEVNFSLMSLDEFQYRKDMTDKFLYTILEAQKKVMIDRLNERALEEGER